MPQSMTFDEAKREASRLGFSFRRTGHGDEIRVCKRGEPEDRASYECGVSAALGTVRAEAAWFLANMAMGTGRGGHDCGVDSDFDAMTWGGA